MIERNTYNELRIYLLFLLYLKTSNLIRFLFLILFVLFFIDFNAFGAPHFEPNHAFPTANQSQNACYFNSVNIAVEAKYGTKFRIKKVLQMINFDWTSLATWEYKKKFSDATHIQVKEYSTKNDFIKLVDNGEPVLVSTEIVLKSKKTVRHVSVWYSYDSEGIWVSDPLVWKRKRINWNEVFTPNGKVKYYNLRTIWIKPYNKWNATSIKRETYEDIWVNEKLIIKK